MPPATPFATLRACHPTTGTVLSMMKSWLRSLLVWRVEPIDCKTSPHPCPLLYRQIHLLTGSNDADVCKQTGQPRRKWICLIRFAEESGWPSLFEHGNRTKKRRNVNYPA